MEKNPLELKVEEFLSDVKTEYEFVRDYEKKLQNGESFTLKEAMEVSPKEYRYRKRIADLIDGILSSDNPEEMLKRAFILIPAEKQEGLKKGILKSSGLLDYGFQSIYDSADVSVFEKFRRATQYARENHLLNVFLNNMREYCINSIRSELLNEVSEEKPVDYLLKEVLNKASSLGLSLEDILPFEPSLPSDEDYLPDHPQMTQKINAIISRLDVQTDKETIDSLQKANEILIQADKKAADYNSDAAESYGRRSEEFFNKRTIALTKECIPEKKILLDDYRSIETAPGDLEALKEGLQFFLRASAKTSKTDAAKILEIYQKMKDAGILADHAVGESGGKAYGFLKLTEIRNSLEIAVKTEKLSEINRLTKEYEKLDQIYSELVNEVKTLGDGESIPANVSPARVNNIPKKYRTDIVGSSRLSGIYIAASMAEEMKIPFEDFIMNPAKIFYENYRYHKCEGSKANQYLNNPDLIHVLKGMTEKDGNFSKSYQEDCKLDALTLRGCGGVISLLSEERDRDILEAQSDFVTQLTSQGAAFASPGSHLNSSTDLFAAVIGMEPGERNYYHLKESAFGYSDPVTFTPVKKFNLTDYFSYRKPFSKNVTMRIAEAVLSMNGLGKKEAGYILAGIEAAATAAVSSAIPFTEKEKELISLAGKAEKTPAEKMALKSLCYAYQAIRQEKVSLDAFAVKSLAELKKSYDEKNVFEKLFSKEGKLLRHTIQNIENDFSEKVSKKALKRHVRDLCQELKTNPDAFQNMEESSRERVSLPNEEMKEERESFSKETSPALKEVKELNK